MEAIRNILNQIGPKRLILMSGVAVALLAALAFVATRGSDPQMGFLYTDLDPAAAQGIAEKLDAQNVPYRLSADGSSILAPQDKLAELRMGLAGERLGGPIGYEVLDQQQAFGVSASRARIDETRAIEGELSRSIESLDTISRARVHIVMPERAMFETEHRPATAAVTVHTRGRLPSETVEAIRYLVSSSVPELSPESVSIVDQTGALLARAGDPASGGGGGDVDQRQAAIESRLRDQVEALLEPIVGQGKVRAEVSAQIDRDTTREEANVFDPDAQVIAHQVTVESGNQDQESNAAPQGASVAAQLPDAQATTGAGGDTRRSVSNQTSEDVTYDNSSRHTTTLRSPGTVKRLSVAVMVDGGERGLPQAEVQRLTRLVENAVGADSQRGDSVVVESMKFTAADDAAASESSIWSLLSMDRIIGLIELLVIAGAGLFALRMLKPKGAVPAPEPLAEPIPLEAMTPEMLALASRAAEGDEEARDQLQALEAEQRPTLDQEIALANVDGRIKLSALKQIGEAVTASPPEAASVIRQWMNA